MIYRIPVFKLQYTVYPIKKAPVYRIPKNPGRPCAVAPPKRLTNSQVRWPHLSLQSKDYQNRESTISFTFTRITAQPIKNERQRLPSVLVIDNELQCFFNICLTFTKAVIAVTFIFPTVCCNLIDQWLSPV